MLCGQAWFDETFRQLDERIAVTWRRQDGDRLDAGSVVCELRGPARPILTGERTALNFLQSLSATATAAAEYVDAVAGTGARILDTRKTIPGLRTAQKYAVRCAGAGNHRIGLFDAILIKENHIEAFGSIENAIGAAHPKSPSVLVEIEVETLDQLELALASAADRVMLDNFSEDLLRTAVSMRDRSNPGIKLEASGGIGLDKVRAIAATGVDYISIGSITKNIRAIDFSLRVVHTV